jgi:hypothetical protein
MQEVSVRREHQMKKFMLVLLAVGLIALAMIPTACKKAETPTEYSTYHLVGATFSYPTDWKEMTDSLEKGFARADPDYENKVSGALWADPSASAMVVVAILDLDNFSSSTKLPEVLTVDMKKDSAVILSETLLPTLVEQYSITDQQETYVSGEWAWQMEFTGKSEGVETKGYIVNVFDGHKMLCLAYSVKSKDWDKLGSVYNTIKDSIKFE